MKQEQINKLIQQRDMTIDKIEGLKFTKNTETRRALLESVFSLDKLLAKLGKSKQTKDER